MLEGLLVPLLTVFILILLSAFFSGSETGITSVSKEKIHKLKMEGDKRAITLSLLREDKERLIGAILLGNNFVNIAASAIATSIALQVFGESGVVIATGIMTALVLIFAEVMPKTYAVRNAEKVALFVAPIFVGITKILSPLTHAVQVVVNKVLSVITRKDSGTLVGGMDALRGAIELYHEEGHVVHEDKYMLGSLIDLEQITVEEVMIHRKEMKSVSIEDKPSDIVNYVINSTFSRIPIWEKAQDNITGILHVKDILRLYKNKGDKITQKDIEGIARDPWFIPETTNLKNQLAEFRKKRVHFALVVDEYGELMGLVTLEDIIEEVVGQIEDEHDVKEASRVKKCSDGSINVNGDLSIRDLNREMHWELPDDDAATIGGLMFHIAQRVPSIGESFKFGDYNFKLLKKKQNKIMKLKIKKRKSRKKIEK